MVKHQINEMQALVQVTQLQELELEDNLEDKCCCHNYNQQDKKRKCTFTTCRHRYELHPFLQPENFRSLEQWMDIVA